MAHIPTCLSGSSEADWLIKNHWAQESGFWTQAMVTVRSLDAIARGQIESATISIGPEASTGDEGGEEDDAPD